MKKIEIFKDGQDTGYISDNNQHWWFDPSNPNSFELFDLDGFYDDFYFREDHVNINQVENYVFYIKEFYKNITNKELKSVFECGAGAGWFTKKFLDTGINDIYSIEGSISGYNKCLLRGISDSIIHRFDLRNSINLNRKFDISICTEVAEHIETPFSSQLIKTLTDHSDIVWFSFEPPDTNNSHYHHCNEQPEKFWVNLFDFFGYGSIRIPMDIYVKVGFRGSHIFYKKELYE